ncbi:hypothetical protein WMO40_17805 [Bacillaceae bacterium CLA-AA-H227]|uniref:Uncharacterized protein n=1 Tax=Robertmurraya yapensis (ex Hitch et al 2024) TaxID=3133160 RepID=A0ACC6SER4_9BACI
MTVLVFLIISTICLFFALRRKKTIFLVIPFLTIFLYFIVQIALVPLPFLDTIKFIFSLNN